MANRFHVVSATRAAANSPDGSGRLAGAAAVLKSTLLGATLVLGGVASSLVAPAAYAGPNDEPSGGEMMVDAVIARPIGLATTVVGTAAFLVALPFAAMGGNIDKAAEKLVIDPARETFVRCLGCRQTGHPDRFRGKEGEIE